MIRVPDTSAGKRGTCPQCSEKLIVPALPTGAGPTATATVPAATVAAPTLEKIELPHIGAPHIDVTTKPVAPRPVATSPTAQPELGRLESQSATGLPQLEPDAPVLIPGLGLPPLDSTGSPSLAQQLARKNRQKKKGQAANWIVPVVCLIALLGFVGWYAWSTQPKLEGKLVAHSEPGFEIPPALIPASLSGLEKPDLQLVLGRLKSTPITWSSTSSRLIFTGADEGIEISLRPGRGYRVVSTKAAQSQALVDYIKTHLDALEKNRMAAIQKQAPKFYAAVKTHFEEKQPIADQTAHRDGVLFPSLVSGFGYHVEAAVGANRYPCVSEDKEGTLYFLVPNATKTFTLQARKELSGALAVPANFTVSITSDSGSTSGSKKKSRSKTQAERESENQGMNPDLIDSEMDQNVSEADALKAGLGDLLAPDGPQTKSVRQMKLDAMEDDEMPDTAMPGKPKSKSGMKSMPLKDGMMSGEMPEGAMTEGETMDDASEMMPKSKSKSKPKTAPKK